jgi:predicted transcriptional regulator
MAMTGNAYLVLMMIWIGHNFDAREAWISTAIDILINQLLIEYSKDNYVLTERGSVLINHIKNLPLPVQIWSMPK